MRSGRAAREGPTHSSSAKVGNYFNYSEKREREREGRGRREGGQERERDGKMR